MAELYKMDHKLRGIAIVMNIMKFTNDVHTERIGSELDVENLKKTLKKALKFDVRITRNNLEAHEILKFFRLCASDKTFIETHANSDCFMCVLMSHGRNKVIIGADNKPVYIRELIDIIKNCEELIGKPKLFFIQACRENHVKKRVKSDSNEFYDQSNLENFLEDDNSEDSVTILETDRNKDKDIYIHYSTIENDVSKRHIEKGSFFINSICEVFEEHSETIRFSEMLLLINKKLSEKIHQTSTADNRLTADIYFGKKDSNTLSKPKLTDNDRDLMNIKYLDDDPDSAKWLFLLGRKHEYFGDYEKALIHYNSSFLMQKRLSQYDSNEKIKTLHYLLSCYTNLGDKENSLTFALKLYEMRSRFYKDDPFMLALNKNNIGNFFIKMKGDENKQKALDYQVESYELIKTHMQTQDNFDIAAILNNIGICYQYKKDYQKALHYCKEAYEMRLRLHNKSNNTNIASSLNNIGNIYGYLGEHKEALKYKLDAYEMLKSVFKQKNHPTLASILNNIGISYSKLGDNIEALKYKEMAFKMRHSMYFGVTKKSHPDYIASLKSLTITYGVLKDKENFEKYKSEYFSCRDHSVIFSSYSPKFQKAVINI